MEPGFFGMHHVCCRVCELVVDTRLLGDWQTQAWEAQAQVACRSLATGCLSFSSSGAHAVRLYRIPSSLQPQDEGCTGCRDNQEVQGWIACKNTLASKLAHMGTSLSPLCYDARSILQSGLPCIALQLRPKLVIGHGDQQTLDNASNILQVLEAIQRWPAAPWCRP